VKLDRLIACTAHEVHRCLQSIDAIVAPTTPQAAFAFGGEIPETQGDFCGLANLAGCAAVSVPMGANSLGLPLGLQIIAPAGGDNRALAVASAYERAAAWRLPLPRDGPAPAN
jgi:aspartyl-tRNA(Asn)/glutamyl-tRNA(Gln) amidotransferase subunit A